MLLFYWCSTLPIVNRSGLRASAKCLNYKWYIISYKKIILNTTQNPSTKCIANYIKSGVYSVYLKSHFLPLHFYFIYIFFWSDAPGKSWTPTSGFVTRRVAYCISWPTSWHNTLKVCCTAGVTFSLASARLITWSMDSLTRSPMVSVWTSAHREQVWEIRKWSGQSVTAFQLNSESCSHWLTRSFFDFSYSLPMGRSPDWYHGGTCEWIHDISLAAG